MRIVVLAGGIGGARFLLGVRAYARTLGADGDRGGQCRRRRDACTACGSAPTWTASCTRWAAAPTRSAAGAGSARPGRSRRSWPRTARSRPGSAWATRTSPPTWCAPRCSTPATRSRRSPRRCAPAGSPASRLLPATDDRLETHVVVDRATGEREAHPLPGVVGPPPRRRADPPVRLRRRRGGQAGAPACSTRSRAADVVLVAPSNPVVSIAPILAVPGLRDAVVGRPGAGGRRLADHRRRAGARHGRPLPGRARRRGAARPAWAGSTAPAARGGLLDGWLVDTADAGDRGAGVEVRAVPLWMTDEDGDRGDGRRGARAGGSGAMTDGLRDPAGPRASATSPPGDDLAALIAAAAPVAARRRRAGGHQQDRVEGRGPAGRRAGRRAGARGRPRRRRCAAETARVVARRGADPDRADPPRLRDGRRPASTRPTWTRPAWCCCPRTRTPRPARCAPRCASGSASTSRVIVSDTMGRPWRNGLTDVALGAAGHRADPRPPGRDRPVRQRAAAHPDGRGRRAGRRRRAGQGQVRPGAGRGGPRLPPGADRRPTARARPRWSATRRRTCSRWARPRRARPACAPPPVPDDASLPSRRRTTVDRRGGGAQDRGRGRPAPGRGTIAAGRWPGTRPPGLPTGTHTHRRARRRAPARPVRVRRGGAPAAVRAGGRRAGQRSGSTRGTGRRDPAAVGAARDVARVPRWPPGRRASRGAVGPGAADPVPARRRRARPSVPGSPPATAEQAAVRARFLDLLATQPGACRRRQPGSPSSRRARSWSSADARPRPAVPARAGWGAGSSSVATASPGDATLAAAALREATEESGIVGPADPPGTDRPRRPPGALPVRPEPALRRAVRRPGPDRSSAPGQRRVGRPGAGSPPTTCPAPLAPTRPTGSSSPALAAARAARRTLALPMD